MNKSRLGDIINAAIEWAINVSEQTTKDLIKGMSITNAELRELGWEEDSLNILNEIE